MGDRFGAVVRADIRYSVLGVSHGMGRRMVVPVDGVNPGSNSID